MGAIVKAALVEQKGRFPCGSIFLICGKCLWNASLLSVDRIGKAIETGMCPQCRKYSLDAIPLDG
jgi:hypothetical protein